MLTAYSAKYSAIHTTLELTCSVVARTTPAQFTSGGGSLLLLLVPAAVVAAVHAAL
jgi:acyl-CoA hydrolase